jgi:hypothetical protein
MRPSDGVVGGLQRRTAKEVPAATVELTRA